MITTLTDTRLYDTRPLANASQHKHASSEGKVKRFREWLRRRLGVSLVGDEIIEHYIREAHGTGHRRAHDDLRRADAPAQAAPVPQDPIHQAAMAGYLDRGHGVHPLPPTDEHKAGSAGPVPYLTQPLYFPQRDTRPSVAKIKLLSARTFHEMEGVTQRMAADMSRTLAEGMARSWSPKRIAREMHKAVKIGLKRALVVVHTEMIRAHAEGQLMAMEEAGETHVLAKVEWQTTGDGRVCPVCRAMEGKKLSLEDAKGMIPMHPNCRCVWLPVRPERTAPPPAKATKRGHKVVRNEEYLPPTDLIEGDPLDRFSAWASEQQALILQDMVDNKITGKFEEQKYRRVAGKFATKPSEQATTADADVGPSSPESRHKGAAPKALPWRAPPPKVPRAEGVAIRPTGANSQTAVGDHTELLATTLGFRNILPEGQRSHKAGEVKTKGSTIDVEYDHSGRAYEIKACKTTSSEYRLKAKKSEKDAKLLYAEKNNLTAYTMVAVRDEAAAEIHFYVANKPGLIGSEVNPHDYDYVGTVPFDAAPAKKG